MAPLHPEYSFTDSLTLACWLPIPLHKFNYIRNKINRTVIRNFMIPIINQCHTSYKNHANLGCLDGEINVTVVYLSLEYFLPNFISFTLRDANNVF